MDKFQPSTSCLPFVQPCHIDTVRHVLLEALESRNSLLGMSKSLGDLWTQWAIEKYHLLNVQKPLNTTKHPPTWEIRSRDSIIHDMFISFGYEKIKKDKANNDSVVYTDIQTFAYTIYSNRIW